MRVGHLILNGTVTGPVSASELLELQPHARVYGEVHYAALEMHQGAIVEGRLVPIGQGEVRALPNHVPAAEVNQETPMESNTSEAEAGEVSSSVTPENAGATA